MLKQLWLVIGVVVLLSGCGTLPAKREPNLPQMPYNEWRIGGVYPHYFKAKVFQVMMKTQSNDWKMIDILMGDNQNRNPGEWQLPMGTGGLFIRYNLPQELYICWSSFADQTFYKTKIVVPLWARQEMVTPHQYFSSARNKDHIGYNNNITIGFAPGGNVTGWLTGLPSEDGIEFTQGMVTTQRIPQGSDVCPNPYPNGKITEISDEAKAWLKKYGMPEAWQEKNNNITIGSDIRIKNLPAFGNEL